MFFNQGPNNFFEKNLEVSPVKSATVTLGVGNNQTIINAVADKKIRVLGIQAFTTTGLFNFKNGSGGAALMYPPITAIPDFKMPVSSLGYFETDVNTALVTDVTIAIVNLLVIYIEYIP